MNTPLTPKTNTPPKNAFKNPTKAFYHQTSAKTPSFRVQDVSA